VYQKAPEHRQFACGRPSGNNATPALGLVGCHELVSHRPEYRFGLLASIKSLSGCVGSRPAKTATTRLTRLILPPATAGSLGCCITASVGKTSRLPALSRPEPQRGQHLLLEMTQQQIPLPSRPPRCLAGTLLR
jgi:hypothetical protein